MKQSINIKEIRDIANRFDTACLDQCMEQVLQGKANPCYSQPEADEMMNVLAKASFVRAQIEAGVSVSVALRELGKRIRKIQG